MTEQRVTRRLAAILAADMVGFSRLMGKDEEGTLAALTARRAELIDPSIAEHRGRVFKTTGDGLLAEFASVVDAVRCAIAIQERMREHNTEAADSRIIEFRIGVNIGDVIVQDDDVFGDGVNVAARLEGLSEPGSVNISGSVHDQIKDKLDVAFEDLGPKALKNIAEPVRAWRWRSEAADKARTTLELPDKPSIAVLPFENMSGDPEQEHFADGMAEDIITSLSRMPWFFVIARNSSFTYKGRAVDVTKVGTELGVKYVLEGSVRKGGNRLRITAQLIDAKTGNHIWAERYDRELIDIFEVQDEVTQAIVAAVAPEFLSTEAKAARRKDPAHLDAWECVMRGRAHLWKLGREDAAEARQLFERAIELAPGGEFGASDLALVHFLEFFYGWGGPPEQSLKNMLAAAQKAIAADGSDALAWTVLAWASQFAHRWDDAIEAIERAIQLSPNFVPAIGIRGGIRALNGEPDSAIESISKAARLSPSDGFMPIWMLCLFWAYYAKGQYEEAAKAALRGLRTAPDNPTLRRQLAAVYAMLDRMDEARAALDDYLRIEPNHTIADARRIPCNVPENLERYLDGLRKAGLPE